MAEIGEYCFKESGLEEIEIPRTVTTIGADAFEKCENIRIVQVDNHYEYSLSRTGIPASAGIVFQQGTTVWSRSLLLLRKLKEVAVPDSTEKIENYWFWGSSVEIV